MKYKFIITVLILFSFPLLAKGEEVVGTEPSLPPSHTENAVQRFFANSNSWLVPIPSVGLGYPQGIAVAAALLFPAKENTSNFAHGSLSDLPVTSPSLRIEAEVGGFGEGVAGGVTIPFAGWGMVTLKKERIFENWQGPRDESCSFFDGYVFEYAVPQAKVGLGSFRETKSFHNTDRSFIYFFIGFGG